MKFRQCTAAHSLPDGKAAPDGAQDQRRKINGLLLLSSPRMALRARSLSLSASNLFGNHLRGLLDIVPVEVFLRREAVRVERLPTPRTVAVYIETAFDCS